MCVCLKQAVGLLFVANPSGGLHGWSLAPDRVLVSGQLVEQIVNRCRHSMLARLTFVGTVITILWKNESMIMTCESYE